MMTGANQNFDHIDLNKWERIHSEEEPPINTKMNLLMVLVDRVKTLDGVVVKSTSYINDDDELVVMSGPWSVAKKVPVSMVHDDDTDDEVEVEGVQQQTMSPFRHRAPSTTNSHYLEETSTRRRTTGSHVVRSTAKCVVRNEFGHARIQQYVMQQSRAHNHGHGHHHGQGHANSHNHGAAEEAGEVFETGGHCVLHSAVFQKCIDQGWGMKHPLAGHFHPIVGTEIPETTMLFRVPRNATELEVIWNIVQKSYLWVTSPSSN